MRISCTVRNIGSLCPLGRHRFVSWACVLFLKSCIGFLPYTTNLFIFFSG